jgi:hypothetical protein
MVHTDGTYQRYVTDQENVMEQPSIALAAARLAERGRPLGLGAWREVSATGALAGDTDPDATAAGLVRRWHQHLAVAIDLPVERLSPGEERLHALSAAWLDHARRTARVRGYVERHRGPRSDAETGRQRALLVQLLADDLAALGAAAPVRAAHDVLDDLAAVAAAEDAADAVLPALRAPLIAPPRPPRSALRARLAGLLRPIPA